MEDKDILQMQKVNCTHNVTDYTATTVFFDILFRFNYHLLH